MKTWQRLKANPELFKRYFVKEYLISATRKFFENRGYHELESPILASSLPQERYCDVLETKIEQKGKPSKVAYLIPTTETYNKKILAAGLGEHFVITKVARGLEDIGPNHSPEFTMLEWYHLNADYFDLMEDCEELIKFQKKFIDERLGNKVSLQFDFQNVQIDLAQRWERASVRELLQKYADVSLEEIYELEKLKKVMVSKGYNVEHKDDWQTLFELLFANEVEPNFSKVKPTFVYDYPRHLCPLVQVKKNDEKVCEKVELYISGRELANGYTELRDWKEQEKRFKEEQKARIEMGKRTVAFDYDLVEALKSGLPPVAGIGMGLDRLAMIFANAASIADINYFPATE